VRLRVPYFCPVQKLTSFILFLFAFLQSACGQSSPNRLGHCQNPRFDREVAAWLSFKVPAIDVDSLRHSLGTVTVLDAREPQEYTVSHIAGAINCGYDGFDLSKLEGLDKSRPVVVYCSIGYRSEKVAQKLKKSGLLRRVKPLRQHL
jgi:Rhodanese-related sulfurtransferase